MKNIETYIVEHREEFDTFTPPEDLWSKIDAQLGKEIKVLPLSPLRVGHTESSFTGWVRQHWKIAAIFLMVFGLGMGYQAFRQGQAVPADMAAVSPTMANTAVQYVSLIETKRAEIKNLEASDPQLYKAFEGELLALEQSYQLLRKELPASPNPEAMVQAMIDNLQKQIDLLNTQLFIIQRIKTYKKDHEKVSNNPLI